LSSDNKHITETEIMLLQIAMKPKIENNPSSQREFYK